MVKTILLDCGGVLARPVTGIWVFPRNFHALMDGYLAGVSDQAHKDARAKALDILHEDHHLYTEDVEYEQLHKYFRDCYCEFLGLNVPESTLHALAFAQVYDNDRFAFYDDVLPMLQKWRGQYKLGMVSDTHPTLRRIMRAHGSLQMFDAVSLSCDNGVLKPNAKMYEVALQALDADPATTIFVDDLDKNLHGAEKLGIKGVKIARDVYTDGSPTDRGGWTGAFVRSLTELDELLVTL